MKDSRLAVAPRWWGLVLLLIPAAVVAQAPSVPAGPGVDSTEAQWITTHVSPKDATTLYSLLRELSQPEAVQLLPSLFDLDGGRVRHLPAGGQYVDSLAHRPPSGPAGVVRSAYLISRLRTDIDSVFAAGGFYALGFTGQQHLPPRRSGVQPGTSPTIHLAFDFAPAETLMAIIATRDIGPGEAQRRLAGPAFDALIEHRNQSFYAFPLTREQLGIALAHAASTQPLDRLYMYMLPEAFFDYGDVRRFWSDYHVELDSLRANETAVLGYINSAITPYVPAGTRVDRKVSIFFGDGADGWATDSVAAIDLEFFKDDYARLLALLVHETFHAAQSAAAVADSAIVIGAPGDSLLRSALDVAYLEGTASFVSPPSVETPAAVAAAAAEGSRLLDVVYHPPDAQAAQSALNTGQAGAGPFYWLGVEMSRTIAEALGRPALAATLRSGAGGFLRAYVKAVRRRPGGKPLLSPEIMRLGEGPVKH
jgi:hypothetical protein